MILLIGTGLMGIEYAKALAAVKADFVAIGRGEENVKRFEEHTRHSAICGGLENYIKTNTEIPSTAIVAVGVEMLYQVTCQLLDYGVRKILLEKPGGTCPEEIYHLNDIACKAGVTIVLAYNRRFYTSVLKAEAMIKRDGGVTSFNFEFTEWSHVIEKLNKPADVMQHWFLANSTHVVDTAFFLCGLPKTLYSLHKGGTNWHPASSIFAGAGESESGALFSYHANWEAPGRWAIEILTKKNRLYLKPMEILQIQQLGSVDIKVVEINDKLDKEFKPGLYLQTKSFLDGDLSRFCTLQDQKYKIENIYLKMSGY
jgi:predicted dehydrogenase